MDGGESLDNLTDVLNQTCLLQEIFGSFDCSQDSGLILAKALSLTVIILLTICGNFLLLLAVAISPNLRSSTHYLIVNLAVADLLLGTTVLPFSAVFEITKRWYFGQTFCAIWAALDVLLCTTSILSLCVISLDRYIGVTRPLSYSRIMFAKRTSFLILAIWVLAVAISIGPLLGWREPPSVVDPYECKINTQLGYVLFSATGSFYLPAFVILFVYWKIYKAAIRQTKFLECGTKTTKQDVTLRVHLGGGVHGRANSTPDLPFLRACNNKGEFPHHLFNELEKGNNGNENGNGRANKNTLAPLARPEMSSTSSHNNEDYQHNDQGTLRMHRGGKKGKSNGELHWNSVAARAQRQSRYQRHQQQQGLGHPNINSIQRRGSQPNSLTPSPPSSSPERKLNSGFGKIAKFRRQKKAAKTLFCVVGAFLLCWFPFFFILPLGALCEACKVPNSIFDLFFWLGYFNSCLNPFIYICTSREFQRAFRRILCRRAPPRPTNSKAIFRANLQSRANYLERNYDGNHGNAMPLNPINHWG